MSKERKVPRARADTHGLAGRGERQFHETSLNSRFKVSSCLLCLTLTRYDIMRVME
jgi:hypothetical protein